MSDNTQRLELTSDHEGYMRNGKSVPRVSHALDRVYPKTYQIPQEYADRGTAVHIICEAVMNGNKVTEIPDHMKPYVEAFGLWLLSIRWNAIRKEIVLTENRLISKKNYGGTRDIVMPDRGWIVDIKTGIEVKKRDHMQLVAYSDGSPKWKLYNLYLKKDGTFKFKKRLYCPIMYRVFLYGVGILNYTGGINE